MSEAQDLHWLRMKVTSCVSLIETKKKAEIIAMCANKVPHLCVLEGWDVSVSEKAWESKSRIQKRQD